jgi:catechol 2,3-dioxygenase-like lactoylglutathione lyase family enzyme
MKRMHVHMSVADLDQSIRFYSTLFATGPTVKKSDYAKWMLDDPRVNFAISTHSGHAPGVDHLGIQVEDGGELQEVYDRLKGAEGPVLEEGKTTCCYAQSEKSWIADPAGVSWEAFHTTGEATVYGTSAPRVEALAPSTKDGACCGPKAA